MTEDIGGGGLSIYGETGFSIAEGQKLKCWLLVPYRNSTIEHVNFEAEVVTQNPGNRKTAMHAQICADFNRSARKLSSFVLSGNLTIARNRNVVA